MIAWAGWVVALLAAWRWWHWKREAYRTRDEAIRQFRLLRDDIDRATGPGRSAP